MNKLLKREIFILTLAFLFALILETNTYANESLGSVEQVKFINYVTLEDETIDVRFSGDIPYVELSELYKLVANTDLEINSIDTGIYEVTSANGKATINTLNDTLYSGNYANFVEIPEQEEEIPIIIKNFLIEKSGNVKVTDLDFSKYEIDLYGEEEKIWLPVSTAFSMFMVTGFYDGENINYLETSDAMKYVSNNTSEYANKIKRFFENKIRNTVLNKLSYNDICFVFDNYYGFPDHCILSESIKLNGLDYTLSNYNNETKQIKEWLTSNDIGEYYAGMSGLDTYLYDGGHTSVNYGYELFLLKYLEIEEAMDVFTSDEIKKVQNFERYHYQQNKTNSQENIEKNIRENRVDIFGTDNYAEKGDTAVYYFDKFNYDNDAWVNYYQNGGDFPNDTTGNLLKALDRASLNPEIKNFVMDISTNGGGLGFTAPLIMSHLGYNNGIREKNMINNQIEMINIDFDTNHDGEFTEKDEKSKYKFNYAVLTSDLSFSTANLFAALARENGMMVIGEQSGGGACSILSSFTSEGLLYILSSPKNAIDNNGKSVDSGIKVDVDLVEERDDSKDYSSFYDMDNLSDIINKFYGKSKPDEPEPEEPEREEISDNESTINSNTELEESTEEENIANKEYSTAYKSSPTNPRTGDDIMLYVSLLGLSLIGIVWTGSITKKKD